MRDWHMNLSEKENGKSSELWTTWNKSVLPVSKIITGSSFTFLLKKGQVSEIRGLEALRNKLMLAAKARRNIELANVAENRFNELYWHSLLNQWTEGTSAKVLQKGSQWHFTRPASLWSWQPVTISRTVTNLSRNSATLQDSAILDVDTTPRKSQHFRDTAIYAWKYKGSYQNDWFLNQSKGWILQSSEIMQWRGNTLIYGASKQGDLSLLSDTPTTFREETRLVATRLR